MRNYPDGSAKSDRLAECLARHRRSMNLVRTNFNGIVSRSYQFGNHRVNRDYILRVTGCANLQEDEPWHAGH
jgi:hypothetical protein